MRVLFLDLALACGAAYDGPDPGRPITTLLVSPRPEGNKETGFAYGRTFAVFEQLLNRKIDEALPDLVGFEAPIQSLIGGGKRMRTQESTVRVLVTLTGIVEKVCHQRHLPCEEANLMRIKKHLTGSGKADKADMVRMCRVLGIDTGGDHNRSDAAAGWLYLRALHDPSFAVRSTPLLRAIA